MVFFVGLWPHLFASKSHKDFWRKIIIQQHLAASAIAVATTTSKICNFANFAFATESVGRNTV